MSRDNIWFCKKNIKKRIIGGETILLAIKRNSLLILNEQATVIWNQLSDSKLHKEEDIVFEIQKNYPNILI